MTLIGRDESGHVVQLASPIPLAAAEKHPLTVERLREQLGRMGGTPFRLGRLENRLEGEVILPMSELNGLRRELVSQVEQLRARPHRWALVDNPAWTAPASGGSVGRPRLVVLVRNLEQLEAAIPFDLAAIYCEFEDPKKYPQAVARFRAAKTASEIFVAPPRIFKAGEEWILKQVRSCEADGYLARNYDHLKFFADSRRIGDFSLNVANGLAADYFKNHIGLERLTASYDLNISQLEALLQSAPPQWFEINNSSAHADVSHGALCVFLRLS